MQNAFYMWTTHGKHIACMAHTHKMRFAQVLDVCTCMLHLQQHYMPPAFAPMVCIAQVLFILLLSRSTTKGFPLASLCIWCVCARGGPRKHPSSQSCCITSATQTTSGQPCWHSTCSQGALHPALLTIAPLHPSLIPPHQPQQGQHHHGYTSFHPIPLTHTIIDTTPLDPSHLVSTMQQQTTHSSSNYGADKSQGHGCSFSCEHGIVPACLPLHHQAVDMMVTTLCHCLQIAAFNQAFAHKVSKYRPALVHAVHHVALQHALKAHQGLPQACHG